MTKLINTAAVATLIAALAGPAFAAEDSQESLNVSSGRYVAEAGVNVQTNSYIPSKAARVRAIEGGADFQLGGR